jgi:hypothetical protein
MRTEDQKQASRNNGAKSKGPVTPEGRSKSARNRIRHNLAGAHTILLSTENPDEYLAHVNDYIVRFQPIDGVERDVVHRMIAAAWREKRISAMECSLFEVEMFRKTEEVDKEWSMIDGCARQTLALLGTDDMRAAATLLLRYGATARRAFAAAFRTLQELQGDRFNRQPAAMPPVFAPEPPEPEPETTASLTPEAPAPADCAPKVIVFQRRTPEITKLPNEPEKVMAAGQILNPDNSRDNLWVDSGCNTDRGNSAPATWIGSGLALPVSHRAQLPG